VRFNADTVYLDQMLSFNEEAFVVMHALSCVIIQ